MLKKEQVDLIAQVLKIDAEQLNTAITSDEEAEITVPSVKTFTQEEYDELYNNIKTKHYIEGKDVGRDLAVKEARDKHGLKLPEPEGGERQITMDNLLTAFQKKVLADAKLEPDKKVTALEQDKTTLQGKLEQLEQKLQTVQTEYEGKLTQGKINEMIENTIPDKLPEGFNKSDVRYLFQKYYTVELVDGKQIVKKDGQELKDDKLNSRALNAVMSEFFTSKGWDSTPGNGRGGADEFGSSGLEIEFKNIQSKEQLEQFATAKGLTVQDDKIVEMAVKYWTPDQRKKIFARA